MELRATVPELVKFNPYDEGFDVYIPSDIRELTGATSSQLSYWIQLGLVKPYRKARGRGSTGLFTFWDIFKIFVIREMIDSGLSTNVVRIVIDNFPTEIEFNTESPMGICTNGRDYVEKIKDMNKPIIIRHSPIYMISFPELFARFAPTFNSFKETRNGPDRSNPGGD